MTQIGCGWYDWEFYSGKLNVDFKSQNWFLGGWNSDSEINDENFIMKYKWFDTFQS